MTPEEIQIRLKERFGAAIGEWQAPQAGDPFVMVAAAALRDVCEFLNSNADLAFDHLRLITGLDWKDRFSAVYHLYSYGHGHSVTLRADLERKAPCIASVMEIWPAAEWHERETFDLMGIVFEGHPEGLRRILLPDDWVGHPLRKDYVAPKEYNGMTNE